MEPEEDMPGQAGFRMPAEWERHEATWLTWPRPEGISFPGKFEAIPPVYAELIRQLSVHEEVRINVWDAAMEAGVRSALSALGVSLKRVFFHPFPAYEPWCRDHGPVFVVRDRGGGRSRAVIDWQYNAWGGKYPPYDRDNAIPAQVAMFRELEVFVPGMVLEGGSIEVNGAGDLLTTGSCLLNPNRNPDLSREDIETRLRNYLGVERIHWLDCDLEGDDTDGHIDNLARFLDPHTIAAPVESDPADINFKPLQSLWRQLESLTDKERKPFRLVPLPMPGPVEHEGQRLPASYMNFYIANKRVIVPTYRHDNDRRVIALLEEAFPDRAVVGIDATDLIWGLGAFHCITQQEPARDSGPTAPASDG